MQQKAKNFLVSLGILSFTLLFCIGLVEVSVRLFLPVYSPSGMLEFSKSDGGVTLGPKNEEVRQWKNTGDFDVLVHFNKFGLRDDKDLSQSSLSDLFVIGDSMTFGWGIAEGKRFSDLIQKDLGVDAYNIAIPTDINGYGRLLNYALKKGAKIKNIVLGIVMENDIKSYSKAKNKEAGQNKYQRSFVSNLFYEFKYFLTLNSAFYNALTSSIHNNENLKKLAVKMGLITPNLKGINISSFHEDHIQSTVTRIKEIFDGYNYLIVVMPSRALWTGPAQKETQKIHEHFVSLLSKEKLSFVDLRPVLEGQGKPPLSFHFKFDGHWNEQGHALAAKAIEEKIRANPDLFDLKIDRN